MAHLATGLSACGLRRRATGKRTPDTAPWAIISVYLSIVSLSQSHVRAVRCVQAPHCWCLVGWWAGEQAAHLLRVASRLAWQENHQQANVRTAAH